MRFTNLALAVLLFAGPLQAQTRLYFDATAAGAVAPDIDFSWANLFATNRRLNDVKGTTAITVGSVINLAIGVGFYDADRQYVSTQMAAGVVFTSGSTTFKTYAMMREYAAADNVAFCIMAIRVFSADGFSERATLSTVSNKGGVAAEFINNATHRNKICADGDAITASYTTIEGDRLVVEIGYDDTSGAASPQASTKWGENAADCAENQTGTTDCAGWIEFSNTITFIGEPGGAAAPKRTLLGVGQ